MKRVLYISNIEVPYRVEFFNQLARHCILTVLYESDSSGKRNENWAKSVKSNHEKIFLNGIKIKNESFFSFKIMKYICGHYDVIIVGCYNSPVQMFAILMMRLLHIPYILNIDGEVFLKEKGTKTALKKFFLRGAAQYLVAGESVVREIEENTGCKNIIPYYFSSLTEKELKNNSAFSQAQNRNNTILVIGQYFEYKGLDIALKAARLNKALHYKFVGMGQRTELFIKEMGISEEDNIEIIPFLNKKELEREYKRCRMVVLPSRQECWGLVINEAASFGTPVVSTWGSGGGVEFLAQKYPQYLAEPGNPESLYQCIENVLRENDKEYSQYLVRKSRYYSIEKNVKAHLRICG